MWRNIWTRHKKLYLLSNLILLRLFCKVRILLFSSPSFSWNSKPAQYCINKLNKTYTANLSNNRKPAEKANPPRSAQISIGQKSFFPIEIWSLIVSTDKEIWKYIWKSAALGPETRWHLKNFRIWCSTIFKQTIKMSQSDIRLLALSLLCRLQFHDLRHRRIPKKPKHSYWINKTPIEDDLHAGVSLPRFCRARSTLMFSNGTKMIYGDFIGFNGLDVNVLCAISSCFNRSQSDSVSLPTVGVVEYARERKKSQRRASDETREKTVLLLTLSISWNCLIMRIANMTRPGAVNLHNEKLPTC